MIRNMDYNDIQKVVKVHMESFPGFFLTFLGSRFLSLYYSMVCSEPEGIAFVYLNNSSVPAGFVAGTTNPRGFYSRILKRDWLKFSVASLGAIIRRPCIIMRVFRAVFHPSANPVGDNVAGLFSIGVLPELQGTGAGRKLVEAFLAEARKRGCRRVFLSTDRDGNDEVNNFYQKLGFSIEREYVTPEGRRMNEYWITLTEEVS